jgi:hypothetical protein
MRAASYYNFLLSFLLFLIKQHIQTIKISNKDTAESFSAGLSYDS